MRSPSFLLFVCLLCLTFSLPLSAQLALELDSDSVAVTGLPPGGTAVLVGTARYGETYRQRHEVFRELLTDEDGDGRASFAPPEGLPIASLWVAVDDETGAWAVGTPAGYGAAVVELSPTALDGPAPDPSSGGGGPPEVLDRLRLASEAIAQEWLELTVVRTTPGRSGETPAEPPAGPAGPAVWGSAIFEGGTGDEDGAADGALVASLPGLEGRLPSADGAEGDGPPALAGLRPGDVLVMLAPLTAHVYLFQREPGQSGGNGGSGNDGLGVELVLGTGAGMEVIR